MAKKRRQSRKSKAPLWTTVLAALLAILIGIFWNDRANESETNQKDNSSCEMVMAASAFPNDSGWGMFTLVPIDQGDPVTYGEPAVQMTDLALPEYRDDVSLILDNYVWGKFTGGGATEGNTVYSVLPGVGSLANGHPTLSNVAPYVPEVHNAGLSRDASPGAGAITHYHNQMWSVKSNSLSAGDEIVVSYGAKWTGKVSYDQHGIPRKDVQELKETGICLDNIRPQQSTNVEAGRGAFATRLLKKGTVIAPAPLIVIGSREALMIQRNGTDTEINSKQLLVNYCFGHQNSSLLFFPYAPIVNLINHDSVKTNAKLQWSQSSLHFGKKWLEWPLEKIYPMDRTGLLLEIVATRDIKKGEEIFLHYGRDWENAWKKHKVEWKPLEGSDHYKYPYQLEDEKGVLITESDSEPYPRNIQIACFYHYGENKEATGTVEWQLTPNTAKMSSERPCRLLRKDMGRYGEVTYTAEMLNLNPVGEDNIPLGRKHIVSGIPRTAIILTNKMYSSDQHLPNAFRHEIGTPDEIFPEQWKDLQ